MMTKWKELALELATMGKEISQQIAQLEEENAALKRALNEYGQHLPRCNLSPHLAFGTHWQPVCNCGLDDLLTAQEPECKSSS